MPYVQINLGAGRSVEQKRAVVKAVTNALVESAGVKRELVVVHIFDMPYENMDAMFESVNKFGRYPLPSAKTPGAA